jgi:CDP-glucose 4,6-dehydratase
MPPEWRGVVDFLACDVTNAAMMESLLRDRDIHTVFHLAAQAIVGTAQRDPIPTLESNTRGSWTVLEACRSAGVRQVVFASTDKAYGAHAQLPYGEETPLRGRSPYEVSKSCADLIAQAYGTSLGLPVAITRCANFYGGADFNWNRIVPGTIRSALRGERPVIRSDGHFVRDYLYIEDAVSAYLTLADALEGRPELAGRAFNFGNCRPMTVLEIVRLILELCRRPDLTPEVRGEVSHEIREQYVDASLARIELGWRPAFSLEEGLERTIAWYRDVLARENADGDWTTLPARGV